MRYLAMLSLVGCLAVVGDLPSERALTADAGSPPPASPADHIILGPAYTVDASRPWAGAVAIRGREIVYVGDAQGALAWQGPATSIHQLSGDQTLLPGMHDSHVHILEAFHPAVKCLVRPGPSPPVG